MGNTDNQRHQFMTTRWSVIMHAQGDDSQLAIKSLEQLCETYWYPLYAYVRRCGVSPADAQDLTQGFFATFLEKDWVQAVHQEAGRFRSFLLVSIKHYMSKQWQKQKAIKRGGHIQFRSIDFEDAEGRYTHEPSHDLTPDRLFDRSWTIALLETVLADLRSDYEVKGKLGVFDALKDRLTAKTGNIRYAELTERLGMQENAIKIAVHRLRQRYRELIRERVADTVMDPADTDKEIQALFASLNC